MKHAKSNKKVVQESWGTLTAVFGSDELKSIAPKHAQVCEVPGSSHLLAVGYTTFTPEFIPGWVYEAFTAHHSQLAAISFILNYEGDDYICFVLNESLKQRSKKNLEAIRTATGLFLANFYYEDDLLSELTFEQIEQYVEFINAEPSTLTTRSVKLHSTLVELLS